MKSFSSGQVADELGVSPHRLQYLLRDRHVRPAKGPTGAFEWTLDDIKRAARLLDVEVPHTLTDRDAGAASKTAGQQMPEGGV